MSSNVSESDTFPTTVPAPDISDVTYPAIVPDAFSRVASRTRFHENTLTGNYVGTALDQLTVGNSIQQYVPIPPDARVTAANPWRALATPLLQNFRWLKERLPGFKSGTHLLYYQPLIVDGSVNVTPRWRSTVDGGSGVPVAIQVDNTSSGFMHLALPNLPTAGTLTTVTVRVKGDPNSTHGGLPANKPAFSVIRYTPTAGGYGVSVLGTATDSSADLATYRTAHTITLSGLGEDLSTPNFFFGVKFTGEYGANSETLALYVYGVEVSVYGGNL